MDRHNEARDLARAISNFVNRGGDGAALVDELLRDHRTLQQNLMRTVVWPLIQGHAQAREKGWYDLRNDGTTDLAARLVAAVGDQTYLPFV